jgi:hypothetical protein
MTALSEVEQLKKNAKLVADLARQLPGISIEQAREVLKALELELQRWIRERQSAQVLLRQVIAQHDELGFDIKAIFGLTRLATEKVLGLKTAELHSETLAAFESIRLEMRTLHEETHRVADQVRDLVEELRRRTT